MLLPLECFEQLQCSLCHRLLSLFPIYITKNEQNQLLSVCGRCQLPNNHDYSRNEIYENLAKHILFPCINREHGCIEDLLPEDVQQHESTCPYRLSKCVFFQQNNCKWKGHFNNLFEHFKMQHNHLILDNNKFELNMNDDHDIVNILQYQSEVFLFEHNYDHISNDLKCSLIPLGFGKRTIKYYARINLQCEKSTLIHEFPTIIFNQNQSKSLNIHIEDERIMGTIKLADTEEQLRLNYDTKQNEALARIMKCSLCSGMLDLPVNVCNNGHYACNNCKETNCRQCVEQTCEGASCRHSSIKCISCADITFYTKSASIDHILKFIYYQCRYGCPFIGNLYDLNGHYNSCLYQPCVCLLKDESDCKQKHRRKDLIEHIFQEHTESIIDINAIVSFPIDVEAKKRVQQCKFFKYSGIFFKLIVQYDDNAILWTVEVVDSIEDNRNFKFEINISDNDNNRKIIIRESCGDLEFTNEYAAGCYYCIYLHENQILHYIIENTLSFKINIYK